MRVMGANSRILDIALAVGKARKVAAKKTKAAAQITHILRVA